MEKIIRQIQGHSPLDRHIHNVEACKNCSYRKWMWLGLIQVIQYQLGNYNSFFFLNKTIDRVVSYLLQCLIPLWVCFNWMINWLKKWLCKSACTSDKYVVFASAGNWLLLGLSLKGQTSPATMYVVCQH